MSGRRAALALLTGASAVQAASGALAAVLATVLLGPSARGAMVLGLTISGIAAVVGGLGTGSALRSRLPALTHGPVRRGFLAAYTWCSVGAVIAAGAGAALLCALGAPLVDPVMASPMFLCGVAVVTAAQTAIAQQTDVWFAAGRFRAGGGFAAVSAAAGVVGVVVAAAIQLSSATLLLGQGLATALVTGMAAGRLHGAGLAVFARPAVADVAWLVRRGAPVLGATVGFVVAMRADRLLLGVFAGTAAVGIYSVAATLSEAPRMLSGAVGQLLLRDVAMEGAAASYRPARRLALGLTTLACAVIGVGGWILMVPVFGAEFAPARAVLLILLVAEICLVPYGLAARGLIGGGWTSAAGLMGALGAVFAILMFGFAVPLWTILGAAVASVLLYAGLSTVSWQMMVHRLGQAEPEAREPVAVAT